MNRARGRKSQRLPSSETIWGRIPLWVYFVAFSFLALAVGIGFNAWGQWHASTMSMAPDPGVNASQTELGAGKLASEFSLLDGFGQTYTLKPGDGRAHLLVFYMGYF
ncbi:MAG: hypothetical protein HY685_02020 [Chloroflexi bacterium]|nr:hypothetical protein [Chloroflexota bacterium]